MTATAPFTDHSSERLTTGGPADRRWSPLLERLRLWHQNSRTRQRLGRLEPRELLDLALSEDERATECRKWFWQA